MATGQPAAGVPTVMMFVQNLPGVSPHSIEETKAAHLAFSMPAFDNLARKAIGVSGGKSWRKSSGLPNCGGGI
jgi:hypothetical protein